MASTDQYQAGEGYWGRMVQSVTPVIVITQRRTLLVGLRYESRPASELVYPTFYRADPVAPRRYGKRQSFVSSRNLLIHSFAQSITAAEVKPRPSFALVPVANASHAGVSPPRLFPSLLLLVLPVYSVRRYDEFSHRSATCTGYPVQKTGTDSTDCEILPHI